MNNDRSWMLNPKAIRNAKLCIQIVKDELGIKLALSHPGFLALLEEYVELTGSSHLAQAFTKLASLAGLQEEGTIPMELASAADVGTFDERASLPIRKVG